MLKDKIPTKMKDTATSIAHNTKIGKKASPKASKKNSKDEKQVLSLYQYFLSCMDAICFDLDDISNKIIFTR